MRTWTGSTSGPWRSCSSTPGSDASTLRGVRISTSAGPARAELDPAADPPFLLVLTHGAGGGPDSADLLAARQAGLDLGAAGARVACRTARAAGALAVLALAFPLHPPGRPDRSRAAQLAEAGTEVLVVNGARDPFGIPEAGAGIRVVVLPGAAHALAGQGGAIRRVVGAWLTDLRAGTAA